MSQAELLIAPSRFLLEKHVHAGYARQKLAFVDHGIEDRQLIPLSRNREPHHPVRVGYIGSLTPHKGVHVLVEAMRRLPDDLLTAEVYGSPDAYPAYSAWLSELAGDLPNVHLRGAFDHHLLPEVLRNLDIVVVTSLWYENSPVVIQEALSAGVPVVASRIGSLPEKVEEGVHGMLFKAGDAHSLSEVLLRLSTEPDILMRMMKNLRSYRKDLDTHLQQIICRYHEAVDDR
jgi:glycosyltransferase involved in cell wall biosynthesis